MQMDTAAPSTCEGVAIVHDGRRVALKWHRLRRRRSDPLFGIEALKQGLRLGASMEIDLRVTRDGGFVLLHDETLDRETDGAGRVAELGSEDLTHIHYRDTHLHGADGQRRLLFVEDLADLIEGAHPEALLQFDMKDDLAAIGDRGIARLERIFGGGEVPIILSGECLQLIAKLRHDLPNVRRGIDPTERLVELFKAGRKDEVPKQLRAEMAGPTAPEFVYLAWQLILAARDEGIDLVAVCRNEGKKVDAWTFNLADPEHGFSDREWRDFRKLLDLGVDQITTDEAIATERAYRRRLASG